MSQIEDIKSRISIIDVVSNYIRLEKSGKQYKARCPFHNEKSPSFYVSTERNSYHCFGCNASGDIFKFLEKIENIEFKDALKILADRAGVVLDYKRENVDDSVVEILRETSLFFEINLKESIEAKKYLHERGLTDEIIKEFNIGFAKNEWRDLFIYLNSKGYTLEQLVESGLIIKTEENKYYDRFRGRIMFPIKNVSGVIIGFTGRVLPVYDDGKFGKYVNTPETKLYHKSKILFNYDKAKKYIADKREVIVAEGQMDVIMSYQANVKNIIAVSGTAFTEDQVKMINRLSDSVILAFDNDNAGQKASDRTAIMCAYGGLRVYIVMLDEKDIADITLHDKNKWLEILKNKKTLIEFYADKINRLDQVEKIVFIKNQVAPYLRAISSPIERDFNIQDFARLTQISIESIKEELQRKEYLEEENAFYKRQEESILIKNRKEELELELNILSKEFKKELKGKDNSSKNISTKEFIKLEFLDEAEIPDEIYNQKVLELEYKHALNREYYYESLKNYINLLIEEAYKKVKNNKNYTGEEKLLKTNEINNIKNKYQKNNIIETDSKSINMLINQLVNI